MLKKSIEKTSNYNKLQQKRDSGPLMLTALRQGLCGKSTNNYECVAVQELRQKRGSGPLMFTVPRHAICNQSTDNHECGDVQASFLQMDKSS